MELSKQLSNVELSNKLRKLFDELGIQKPSIYFRDCTKSKENEIETWGNKPDWCEDNIPCYSVAELGEMLPKWYASWKDVEKSKLTDDSYVCQDEDKEDAPFFADNNEANARAQCLIYLLENKLLDFNAK